MGNTEFIDKCIRIVKSYYKGAIEEEDIFVVWLCKIVQNNKALISTKARDGRYFEITHNGDKNEIYVDVYEKRDNFVVNVIPNCFPGEVGASK